MRGKMERLFELLVDMRYSGPNIKKAPAPSISLRKKNMRRTLSSGARGNKKRTLREFTQAWKLSYYSVENIQCPFRNEFGSELPGSF